MIGPFERWRKTLTLRKKIMIIVLLFVTVISGVVLLFQEYARVEESLPFFKEDEFILLSNFNVSSTPLSLDEVSRIIEERSPEKVEFIFFKQEKMCDNKLGFWFKAQRSKKLYLFCYPSTFYEFGYKKKEEIGVLNALFRAWEILTNFTKSQ